MRVSKDFLNDYIDINDIDYKELADKMVFAGNEYESITKISSATNLVVGYVLECEKHPESNKLSICKVDLGKETVQILCGAPNVKQGIKVIVAKIGAILPGGITINKAKLAGMESNGMICSLTELGIETKYLTEEDKSGIHILAENATVGEDAISYLGYDDEIIDFELTANRADLLSIMGMAYEVGAIYNRPVKLPSIEINEEGGDINENYSLNIETDKCSLYSAKLVKNVVIKESPLFIKRRLMASGIRPINNVVDISNYVMLEYGQPLHFFDADKLGTHITVRMANEGECLTTLDGNQRQLNSSDIVIANDKEAIALAGVMGGLSTEVTLETKNIMIESAIFDSYSIRNTSKQILRSEASSRFEKGIDPNRTILALKRACYLLNKYASGNVIAGTLIIDKTNKEDKKIIITIDKINSVLGLNLTEKEILDVFDRLKFKYKLNIENIEVIVPTRRMDVNIKEDLIEEVGRIVGFDNVKGSLPISKIKKGSRSSKANYIRMVRDRLVSLGLNQTLTYSLVNEDVSTRFISESFNKVYLNNPISEDRKVMRNSLIMSLLEVYNYNYSRNIKDVNIFEIGSCYSKKEANYLEKTKLTVLMSGTYYSNLWQGININVDFYVIKGLITNLLSYLGLDNRYHFVKNENLNDMHPGRSASILVDNNEIGFIGQIHPNVSKHPVYVVEIDIDLLLSYKVRSIKYKEISKYPSIIKDIAFVLDKKVKSSEVIDVIKKTGGRILTNIEVFDYYVGEQLLESEKSIAYSLTFSDINKTLNDEEVMIVFNKIIESVESKLDGKIRKKHVIE